MAVALQHDLPFGALGSESYLVRSQQEITSHITGLTNRSFLSALLGAADSLLGPIQVDVVTQVDPQTGRAKNVASNVSSAQTCNVAPCAHAVPTPPAARDT